jgi:alkanesulfonate monooxygenase
MRIAARWADEFNLTSSGPDVAAAKFAALDEACRAIGRDPATLARSAMVGVLVGATPAEVAERERTFLEAIGGSADSEAWLAARRTRWIHGTPDEARARVAAFAAAGAERLMLQDMLPWDRGMVELIGAELVRGGR